jgi:hypothetical protein
MNVLKGIKSFFTSREPDPAAAATRSSFSAANNAFDDAWDSIEPYTKRANHRYAIFLASRSAEDAETYHDEIAGYTDPADFEPYTDAELDAHTTAMTRLAAAFDRLTSAFGAFSRTDNLYASAAKFYKATTTLYVLTTDAYSFAARCAMTTALEGNLQAAKDEYEVMLLEGIAANASPDTAATAKAKAAAYKATAAENAAAAKRLEHKATEAEAKAKALCANASSAADRAEEILEDAQ